MIIECSEFNIKLFLPLMFPIFRRVQDYTNAAYMKEDKDSQIFITFRYFISYIFAGILLLILKIRTKSSINKNPKNNEHIRVLITKIESSIHMEELVIKKRKKIKSALFLGLLCVLGLSTFYSRYLFEKKEYFYAKQSTRTFFEMINYAGLSFLILKQKLYKHHYVSAGCISIMLIVIFIFSVPYMKKIFESFVFYFLISLAFGIYDVLKKKYMNVFYNTPYFMMTNIGAINSAFLLIFSEL